MSYKDCIGCLTYVQVFCGNRMQMNRIHFSNMIIIVSFNVKIAIKSQAIFSEEHTIKTVTSTDSRIHMAFARNIHKSYHTTTSKKNT